MISMANPKMNAASQNILREASCAACSSKPKTPAIWCENSMPKIMRTRPTRPPSMSDDEVMRLASSCWPAPQERATSAVVPTPIAINKACREKNRRCPAPTAATEGAPIPPTNLVWTIATSENMRLAVIEGTANCQMLGRLYSAGGATGSVLVNLLPGESNLQGDRLLDPQSQHSIVKNAEHN